jgi:hypothetical protein
MTGDETEVPNSERNGRRRRRRRRRGGGGSDEGTAAGFADNLLVAEDDDDGSDEAPVRAERPRSNNRRQAVEVEGPVASVPSTGRNPHRKRNSRARRAAPGSASARRRRMSRSELDNVGTWLRRLPESLTGNLYRGLGGQPNRVTSYDRMIQLIVRALAQGGRVGALVRSLHERDRKALAALLQVGGLAHAEEFHRDLTLAFGGNERDWKRSMTALGERGLVVATNEVDGDFFYVLLEPLVDGLVAELGADLAVPAFEHPDVRVIEERPFCPPLAFSITSLATYIDQRAPRLTQRHEIYRNDQEDMDRFFSQLWEADSDLFTFHLDFLMMHGMVELRGEYLSLNRDVLEEWLELEPEDQRDLLFRALDRRFSMGEWVLWAIQQATADTEDGWVAERPLVTLYRRWRRGEDWRDRFARGQWRAARTNERDSFSFAPLVRAGVLEMGQWGQEKFYRLSPRGRQLLEPDEDDGFRQFYLTPSFEIMAPAGLAPILLFRIGELANLVGCDRANTYKIDPTQVERALQRGWKRDDVLQFLRDGSQIGLPDNVEQTLKGWIGHRGDVEFHELTLMTVHRSQIKRLEGNRAIKPYLLHRFAPGAYAVDRARIDEIVAVLKDASFDPSGEVRHYPGDPGQVEARQALHKIVAEAREGARDPVGNTLALVAPEKLAPVPGTRVAEVGGGEPDLPPKVTEQEARQIIERALVKELDLEMVYVAKTGQRVECLVTPQRMAYKSETPVLVGLDVGENEARSFLLDRIERLRAVEAS